MKRKIISMLVIIITIILGIYAIFWFASFSVKPTKIGISFNEEHSKSLGLDWKKNYEEMLKDLKPEYIRVAAMWNKIESEKNKFYFDDVDFMMDLAEEYNAKVVLVVGQKAPRWPECHVPEWNDYTAQESADHLMSYVTKVVERYKNHEALEFWQVENEPFIRFAFGNCEGYREDLVEDEIELVKKLDQNHKIVITDSGELSFWYKASKAGDIFGTTLYRVVRTKSGKVVKYWWLPPGFYKLKAAVLGIKSENFFVSELQAEPWFTDSTPLDTPLDMQEETMNPEIMKEHIAYADRVGATRTYLWGVEWWYWAKEKAGDSRYWDLIKKVIEDRKIK